MSSPDCTDYYRDERGELYLIGNYGQRLYVDGDGIDDGSKFKFNKLLPVLNFAWDLFKNVDQQNFVMAPLSPQILLSFLVKEATGKTKKEILNAVKFNDSQELEHLVSNMLKEPTSRELKIGNGIFVDYNNNK
jgi:serine protease inhibitor